MIFVGVDWAEAHHDVFVQDVDGKRVAGGRLPEGVGGIARFHEMVGAHAEEPDEVVIGIETDRGLFVGALVAAGYQVFAVNPMSTSRYRDRHSTSGAKSDPGDAKVLADMVRTDRHNHRPVAGDSELAEAIKVLARAHQTMIWSRTRQTNFLRSTLREFYPAALVAFDDLTSGDALELLQIAPTPTLGAGLSRSKIAAALRRGGRQRRVDPVSYTHLDVYKRQIAAMHERHPSLTFDCTIKVEHILRHPDVLPELSQAGCAFIVSAFESTNNTILDYLDKGHSVADASRAIVSLREHGIEVRPSWLPFTPWTTCLLYTSRCV